MFGIQHRMRFSIFRYACSTFLSRPSWHGYQCFYSNTAKIHLFSSFAKYFLQKRIIENRPRFSPNIYLTLNILTSIIWIVVLFNIVSIKGNCAEQRLFENNGYVNRGKLAFAYHFSLSKIYRHQVCLGYSQQPLGRNSTSQINTMRSTICKYLCLLPSKVASCHR